MSPGDTVLMVYGQAFVIISYDVMFSLFLITRYMVE
jgi:hypothetical protein